MTTALIDGDVVAYMAAFAAQRIVYYVEYQMEGMPLESHQFVDKKEAEDFKNYNIEKWKNNPFSIDIVIRKEIIAESAKHAEMCARQIIMKILGDTKATNYKLYLTAEDKSNFRFKIAKTKPYKGNRLKSLCCSATVRHKLNCYVCIKCSNVCEILDTKPVHYHHIRNYLHLAWEGYVVVGEEADDYISIEQCKNLIRNDAGVVIDSTTISATIDKDILNQVPGRHYNIKTGETHLTTEDDALRFFWKQMLMGDTVDNIQGVPRIGKKIAERVLKSCFTLKDCDEMVKQQYSKHYKEDWESKYLEMGNLLWIKREPNIIFEDLKL